MSISADEIADSATHKSFIEKRIRHSSVPQTARPQVNILSLSSFDKDKICFCNRSHQGEGEGRLNKLCFLHYFLAVWPI